MLNVKRKAFVNAIIEQVRSKCHDLGISQGAIGVGISLDGFREWYEWAESPESASVELTIAPITAHGDTFCFDENGRIVEDGAGTVAAKIAGLRRLLISYDEEGGVLNSIDQYTSGALPERMVIPGTSNERGAVAIPIGQLIGGFCGCQGARALTVYIGVSGGTEEQNEAAAWSALPYVNDEVDKVYGLMLSRAFYGNND